jgi:tetratricopeptide (TPR) repeat protein
MQEGDEGERFDELTLAGDRLSSEEAAELESAVAQDPADLDNRARLLGYYSPHMFDSEDARAAYERHALWVVENRPESPLAGTVVMTGLCGLGDETAENATHLWQKQVDASPRSAPVLSNAAMLLEHTDEQLGEEYLRKGQELEPDNFEWHERLGLHLFLSGIRDAPPEERRKRAEKALEEYEKAATLCRVPERRQLILEYQAKTAIESGNLEKAEWYARKLLASAGNPTAPLCGNALHHGNLILGRVALQRGDVEKAEEHLMAAGSRHAILQREVCGPNMALAKELLERGEREVVLRFLKLWEGSWAKRLGDLAKWTEAIENGEIPDFEANLFY